MKYVVYFNGLLRNEGPVTDNCDYYMIGARPVFYFKIKNFDIVSIFCYDDSGLLVERRDYYCLDSSANSPLRARKKIVTRFSHNR